MINISYEGPLIRLQTAYIEKDKCTQVMGGTWNRKAKAWEYLLTAAVAADVCRVFHGQISKEDLPFLEQLAERLLKAKDTVDGKYPLVVPTSKTKPWQHQIVSYNMAVALLGLKDIIDVGGGMMLGHDMGVGKSKCVVDLISNHQDKIRTVLVICPNSAITVWTGSENLSGQFERHATDKSYRGMMIVPLKMKNGSVEKKTKLAEKTRMHAYLTKKQFIAVVNYESAWRDPLASWIKDVGFDVIVTDEAHRLKSAGSKVSKYMARLAHHCKYRIGPTGTPTPHSLTDIYGSYRFLDPGIYGTSYHRFQAQYAVMGGFQAKQVLRFQNVDELHDKMFQICHRVLSDDVLDLPEFIDVERTAEFNTEERRIYDEMNHNFCVQLEAGEVTAANGLVKLLRLQEICSGYVNGILIGDTKKKLLADVMEDFAPKEPVVVFAWFTRDLASIREVAESQGRRYCELSGQANELDKWQNGGGDVLGVQIRSGKESVDFTRAHYDIFYATGLSLGDYQQCRKRTDRQGQIHRGTHIHLVIEKSVDVKILKALRANREVIAAVIDQYHAELDPPALACNQ